METSTLAPIALFAYKRVNELNRTIEALQHNYLAPESDLYIFVDGPRQPKDQPKVDEVRKAVQAIHGFRNVYLSISEINIGCANSIIAGVTKVLEHASSVVVVEDDIVTSPNFLDYMNQCLSTYQHEPKVFSIGAYTFPFLKPTGYTDDIYFYRRTCAWGWGIWANRWNKVDWSISDFDSFIADKAQRRAFNYYGSDRVRMLQKVLKKEIDTWDILLCYNQFKQRSFTVYPTISKVKNIGFYSDDASNTNIFNRYNTTFDIGEKRNFSLSTNVIECPTYVKQFRYKFSIYVRLLNRFRTIIGLR